MIIPFPGKPTIQNFSFDASQQSINCISVDGPASDVSWMRNGKKLTLDEVTHSQIQRIVNTFESMYINTLFIRNNDLAKVAGNYSCTVSNLRGISTEELNIKGEEPHLFLDYSYTLLAQPDICITGDEFVLPYGSSTTLNCTTDLAVNTIEWLDVDGRVVASGTDPQLEIRVTISDSKNLNYTCRVKSDFGIQNKTVTLTISVEEVSNASSAISVTIVLLAIVLLVTAIVITFLVVVRYASKC